MNMENVNALFQAVNVIFNLNLCQGESYKVEGLLFATGSAQF